MRNYISVPGEAAKLDYAVSKAAPAAGAALNSRFKLGKSNYYVNQPLFALLARLG